MEDKETLLFEVIVDIPKVKENAEIARVAIAQLRKERQATEAEFRKGLITEQEQARSLQAIDTQLTRVQGNLKGYQKVLTDSDRAQRAATGSNDQLRAQIAVLTTQLDGLSKTEKENAAVGGVLQARIRATTQELKASQAAVDESRQPMAVYEASIEPLIQALVKLEETQKGVGTNSPEFKQLETEMDALRQQINQVGQTSGLTFDQLQARVKAYGDSIRPTVQRLLELETQQQQIGDVGSEAYQQLGFAIARADRELKGIGGSITGLDEQIAELTSQIEELTEAERKNPAVGGAMIQQLGQLSRQQEKNREELERSKKSTRDYIKEMNILGVNVGDTIQSFRSGGQGVLTFARSILTARGALIALTAVPIVLVLTAVVSFLTRTKDGAELLSRKMAALTAVFDFAMKGLASFGKTLVDAFSNPVKAIKDLGAAIGENLTNRLSAVGEIVGAIASLDPKRALNGFLQLLTGVTNVTGKVSDLVTAMGEAATAGENVARQAQRIADAERALNVERANSRAEIERLKFVSEDVNVTIEDRIKAVKRAFAIENDLLQRQQKLQTAKIANLKAENALHGTTEEGLNKIAEAEKELADTKQESLGLQTEINNKINELTIQGNQQRLQAELAGVNEGLQLLRDRGFQTLELEKQILEKQLELDLVGITKGSQQENALRARYRVDLANLIYEDVLKENERQIQLENDRLQTMLDLAEKGSQAERDLRDKAIKDRMFQEEATARLTIKNAEQREARLKAIQAKGARERLELLKETTQKELTSQQQSISNRIATAREGSREEYDAKLDQIYNAAAQEIAALEEVDKERQKRVDEILAKADEEAAKARRVRVKAQIDQVLDYTEQASGVLSRIYEAQTQAQNNALTQQRENQLKSAGLSAEAREKINARFDAKQAEADRKAAERRRRIASLENLISGARGLTDAIVKNIGNPIMQVIQTALVVATTASNAAVINAQKFNRGGVGRSSNGYASDQRGAYVVGPGTGTSDSIPALISNGESVINARSTKMFYKELSDINVRGGGRAFPGVDAGPTYQQTNFTRMALGGVATSIQARSAAMDYERMAKLLNDAVAKLPAPVVRVSAMRDGIDREVRVENRAEKGLSNQ